VLDSLIDQVRNLIVAASPRDKTVEALLVADAGFKQKTSYYGSVLAYAIDTLKIQDKDIVWVSSWSGATKMIATFGHIDRLVLMSHGVGGGLTFGTTFESVNQLAVPEGPWPSIDQVAIEGCEVARDAVRTFQFARRLKAGRLEGWNMWHGLSNDRVMPGTRVEKIQQRLTMYQRYLLPGTPDAATIKQQADARKGEKDERRKIRFIGREWLREDYVEDEDVPPPGGNRQNFYTRSDAIGNAETITTEQEATEFTQQESQPAGREPRRVTFEPAS
jgi:hypothetical protein